MVVIFPSLRVPLWLFGLPSFGVCFSFFQISLRVLACWFLDVGFQVMFQIAVISEADVIIFAPKTVIGQAWCLYFGSLGTILAAWCLHFGAAGDHFGTLGAPWRTMGAAGETYDGPEPDF